MDDRKLRSRLQVPPLKQNEVNPYALLLAITRSNFFRLFPC